MRRLLFCLLFALSFPLGTTVFGQGSQDWVHRQGPTRNGVVPWNSTYQPAAADRDWKLGEPVWTIKAGYGGASPVLAGHHIYTLGWQDGREFL